MTKEEEIKEFLDWVLPKYAETFRLLAGWDKERAVDGQSGAVKTGS